MEETYIKKMKEQEELDRQEMEELCGGKILELGDKFQFSCKMCGDCCRNRGHNYIILNGVDLYRLSKKLKLHPMEIMEKHCFMYIGHSSKMPLLALRERLDGSCTFLHKGKCTVEDAKPTVCALYPVGRFRPYGKLEFHYFLQKEPCERGSYSWEDIELSRWLDKHDVLEYEQLTLLWQDLFEQLSRYVNDHLDKMEPEALFSYCTIALYAIYEGELDFVKEVKDVTKYLENVLEGFKFVDNGHFFDEVKHE